MNDYHSERSLAIPIVMGIFTFGGMLAGCTVLSAPPQAQPPSVSSQPQQEEQEAQRAPAQPAAPMEAAPAAPPQAPSPPQRQFQLGPAATALVGEARTEEQSRNFGIAAQTLERALSIEPHNPLVWIELGRENLFAGNPAQAYGMGRKALYLATGDPHAQAAAWELIAASLRAQGRNDEAYEAQERAVALSPQ